MSRVCLIAADKPLPLCDRQAERSSSVRVSGKDFTISFVTGFRVAEHAYYRHAVDILNYPIKPYPYELELELHEDDAPTGEEGDAVGHPSPAGADPLEAEPAVVFHHLAELSLDVLLQRGHSFTPRRSLSTISL